MSDSELIEMVKNKLLDGYFDEDLAGMEAESVVIKIRRETKQKERERVKKVLSKWKKTNFKDMVFVLGITGLKQFENEVLKK